MKLLLAAALLAASLPAAAIGRIRLQAASVEVDGVTLQHVDSRLDIHSATRSTLRLEATRVRLPPALQSQTGALEGLSLTCTNPVVREPRVTCPALALAVRVQALASLGLSPLRLSVQARYNLAHGTLEASGTGPTIAGVATPFTLAYAPAAWRGEAVFPPLPLAAWQDFLKPWAALPESLSASGQLRVAARIEGDAGGARAALQATLRDGAFQNAEFTWLGEKLDLEVRARADLATDPLRFELELTGSQGQALLGSLLLDFPANPLAASARGTLAARQLQVDAFEMRQQDLAQVRGSATLALDPFAITAAELTASDVRFPAAYSTYLQQSLATTPFNQLRTTGTASAALRIAGNRPVSLALDVRDLDFSDESRGLDVTGVQAHVDWTTGADSHVRPSFLSWATSRGWGISGARTRLDFSVHDRDFHLLQPARLPFFDGALRINTFAVRNAGEPGMAGDFDAVIEPISVGPIARALGWPEFGGSLAGRIPGLSYRDRELTLQGDIEAQVFDGRVVARNLRVRDPLGSLPRIHADVSARNLDLDLITRTFEFGSITGRLDVELSGLETVGLSPVAFDLKVATPAGDRSRHRISQRAVQSLSNIGGGGGGVAAALQSGALRFFDDFGYDRLGLNCRLRNDVCQMSGAGPAPTGFYIVKGAGVPRIDIIGNNPRVAWLTFIAQAANALSNPGEINVR